MKELCEKSTKPLDSGDVFTIIPISNIKTRETYGNRHCAACHNDADEKNWVQFPLGVICGEAPKGYLKPIKYEAKTTTSYANPLPTAAPSLLRQQFSPQFTNKEPTMKSRKKIAITVANGVIDFEKYSSKAPEICANAVYDRENKEFVSRYENKMFICRWNEKCPDGYKDEAIKEECSIHTNVVYDKQTKKPYRNKDCARCHKKKEDSVVGTPPESRVDLSETVKKGNEPNPEAQKATIQDKKISVEGRLESLQILPRLVKVVI
ncbi:hypothetical protein U1Q18_042328 [Sarracenia purpurea var. burkii]